MDDSDLQHCVDSAPYQALARWQNLLAPHQIQQCVRSSPTGAVRFAFDAIPLYLRSEYLAENPSTAIYTAAEKLTDEELLLCIVGDPHTALKLKSGFSTERKAIVLANSYWSYWREHTYEGLNDFREEVMESIKSHPRVWISAHEGRFEPIIDGIKLHLCHQLGYLDLLDLNETIDASGKGALAEYIASQI